MPVHHQPSRPERRWRELVNDASRDYADNTTRNASGNDLDDNRHDTIGALPGTTIGDGRRESAATECQLILSKELLGLVETSEPYLARFLPWLSVIGLKLPNVLQGATGLQILGGWVCDRVPSAARDTERHLALGIVKKPAASKASHLVCHVFCLLA
jgi:hypothetical protein